MRKAKKVLKSYNINYTFDEENNLNISLQKPNNKINNNNVFGLIQL